MTLPEGNKDVRSAGSRDDPRDGQRSRHRHSLRLYHETQHADSIDALQKWALHNYIDKVVGGYP